MVDLAPKKENLTKKFFFKLFRNRCCEVVQMFAEVRRLHQQLTSLGYFYLLVDCVLRPVLLFSSQGLCLLFCVSMSCPSPTLQHTARLSVYGIDNCMVVHRFRRENMWVCVKINIFVARLSVYWIDICMWDHGLRRKYMRGCIYIYFYTCIDIYICIYTYMRCVVCLYAIEGDRHFLLESRAVVDDVWRQRAATRGS